MYSDSAETDSPGGERRVLITETNVITYFAAKSTFPFF